MMINICISLLLVFIIRWKHNCIGDKNKETQKQQQHTFFTHDTPSALLITKKFLNKFDKVPNL